MTRSELLFAFIDVAFDPLQNYRRYKGMAKEKENFVYDPEFPDECAGEAYYDPELIGEGKPLLPVVLNIHGGGFVKGDMRHRRSLCKRYAKHGYFAANINYRLSPKHKFPAAIIDCAKALNYLTALSAKYNIDLSRVCVTGDSSGAYYATQLVALDANPDLRARLGAPEIVVHPALLVSFCGPYDLPASISLTRLPFHLVWDIGRCYLDTDDFKLKKDFSNLSEYPDIPSVSPINWTNEKWPPTFLTMSEKDFFCKGQGELLNEKLVKSGIETRTFSSTKFFDNHCFHFNFWTKISKDCFRQVFEFMDSHLKPASPEQIDDADSDEN